jgi:hypothetical protein
MLDWLEVVEQREDGVDQGEVAVGQEAEHRVVGADELVAVHVQRRVGVRVPLVFGLGEGGNHLSINNFFFL